MADPYEKQAVDYADARPTYPKEWFSKLSSLTSHHRLAWDVGTGTGQAANAVAEHYDQVIATDVSEALLKHAARHPKVRYIHTPLSTSDDELVAMLGGEGSVDLVTVATAVHWFDLPRFYSVVNRVLRKPGGVIAVWGYNHLISPMEDATKRFFDTTLPYFDPRGWHALNGYRDLPFPFESVQGMGREGEPVVLDMAVPDVSFGRFLSILRSWSAVGRAKERGVDLLAEKVLQELESDWGGPSVVRTITYKVPMLVGTPRPSPSNK